MRPNVSIKPLRAAGDSVSDKASSLAQLQGRDNRRKAAKNFVDNAEPASCRRRRAHFAAIHHAGRFLVANHQAWRSSTTRRQPIHWPPDHFHFTSAGYHKRGERYAETMLPCWAWKRLIPSDAPTGRH
jgi:hypothetical protein